VLKGIDPAQRILNFPSDKLNNKVPGEIIPAVIGNRMAMNAGLSEGDELTIRWRDANGTYDAADIRIVHIFSTVVNTIDAGKIWIPIHKLQQMMRAPNEATIVTVAKNLQTIPAGSPDWIFRDHQYLMKDIKDFAAQKQQRSIIAYIILIGMALLAIFDTQVLSIFRRKKEMGTLMALGMTRGAVIRLFTLEGSLNGLIALILGSIYGIPLLTYTAVEGMSMPGMSQQMFSIGAKLYPQYGIPMYIGTSFLLFLAVVVVSFLPTRKIAKLKPTDALRGKTV
jgi:ABC-type lipoprotein release transport system permease subunit